MLMRVESLSSRLDFNERRVRALEGVVQYRPDALKPMERRSLPADARPGDTSESKDQPGEVGAAGSDQMADTAASRRRRRRRRGRRGTTPAAETTSTTDMAFDPAIEANVNGRAVASQEPETPVMADKASETDRLQSPDSNQP